MKFFFAALFALLALVACGGEKDAGVAINGCKIKPMTSCIRAYLAGAYLAGADLNSADLTGADLTGAYLTGANLNKTDLTGADL